MAQNESSKTFCHNKYVTKSIVFEKWIIEKWQQARNTKNAKACHITKLSDPPICCEKQGSEPRSKRRSHVLSHISIDDLNICWFKIQQILINLKNHSRMGCKYVWLIKFSKKKRNVDMRINVLV